jgi:lipopolysaccharide/colanic/teichoic acid biosynthesis glycosyltransferase
MSGTRTPDLDQPRRRATDTGSADNALDVAAIIESGSRRRPHAQLGLTWVALAAAVPCVSLLPLLYAGLIYGGMIGLPIEMTLHVYMNALCNFVVFMFAWSLVSRARSRVPWLLVMTLVVHGALVFVILLGRLYYSRPMLFTAVLVSILGGVGMIWVRDRLHKPRIAVIAFEGSEEALGWVAGPYDRVTDRRADLRDYDIVLVDFDDERHRDWMSAVSSAMLAGQDVRHLAEYVEDRRGRVSIDHFQLDHVTRPGQTIYRNAKRVLDLVLGLAIAPIAAPLVLLGMIAIALTMGAPIFFTQKRVGYAGKVFTIYKLRTMKRQGEGDATAVGDLRVTWVGKLLRRFRIDELPQLWNVLKGDMSLIGPRPEQPDLARSYVRQMPAFAFRHLVRPGITGWAQVRAGYAANLSETREKLSFDLYYLKNASVTLDLEIAARTAFTLLSGRGVR